VAGQLIHSTVPKPDASAELWPWEELQQVLKDQYHLEIGLNAHYCQQALTAAGSATSATPADYLTDRMKASLQKRFTSYAPDQVRLAQREILLGTFDSCWKDHLSAMDHLKDGIGLLSYGQKDPLIEYKKEGFKLFQSMRERIKAQTIETLATVRFYTEQEIEELKQRQKEELEKQFKEHERQMKLQEAMQQQQQQVKSPPTTSASAVAPQRRDQVKVGRNDPCPCGSGKKFKQCHGLV
jgi:preprotein translocase subunit SecA